MKKYLSFILAVFLTAVIAFSVNAADEKFTVEIGGDAVVSAGTTVNYTFTVKNITLSEGIIGTDIHIKYDISVFELSDAKSEGNPNGWSTGIKKDASAGTVAFTSVENNADISNAIKADNTLKYTISLKVKNNATKQSKIDFSLIQCTGSDFEVYQGSGNALTVSVKQSLTAPSGLSFTDGLAKWNAVENADSYSVQIYKDGKEYGDSVSTSKTEYDFSKELTAGGKYCFTVRAISDKPEYADSAESSKSGDYVVVGKLDTPKITISSDLENGGLKYQITDTNSDGTVRQYIVDIYEKGSSSVAKTLESNSKAGNIPCDGTDIVAGKEYTVTVTAITKDGSVNKDSDTSSHSASAKAAAKVKNIQIKTQPKLVYVDGEKLDLSAMVVTINYDNNTSEDVKFKDFEDYNLTVSIANGKTLSMSDSGKTVTVSFGDKSSATTSAITVNSNECSHTKTHTEQKLPSCGEDGYERVICDNCNATISETILSATGAHQFGDWETIVNPTETLKGVKERVCSVCGHKETEEIPALDNSSGSDSSSDTEPSSTDSDTGSSVPVGTDTTNDTTDNIGGGMSDLSRIFLIVVIVIFSLILLFIVGAVWLENRRNKAKRARMNNRNMNNRSRR